VLRQRTRQTRTDRGSMAVRSNNTLQLCRRFEMPPAISKARASRGSPTPLKQSLRWRGNHPLAGSMPGRCLCQTPRPSTSSARYGSASKGRRVIGHSACSIVNGRVSRIHLTLDRREIWIILSAAPKPSSPAAVVLQAIWQRFGGFNVNLKGGFRNNETEDFSVQ